MPAAAREQLKTSEERLRTGSLRRRVVATVLGLLLVVIAAVCLLVNIILSRRLHDDARTQITERARYAATLSGRGLSSQDLADDLTGQGITASVVSDGTVVVGRDAPPPQIPGAGGQDPSGRPGGSPPGGGEGPAASVHVTVTQSAQALTVTLTLPTGGGTLRLTSSLVEINHTLTLLHRVELGAAGGALAVAGVALVFLVRAALSPLRRMRIVADRIRQGARGERLRPTRPSTDLGLTALALDEMLEALEGAEARAQTAQLGMRQLLADVSHDLRTPIAGVLATSEQLLAHDPGRAEREAQLVDVIREGKRAARLVDDLLLMARLDAGESVSSGPAVSVDARTVLISAVEGLRRRRPDRVVDLTAAPAVVGLDPDRLARILTNLLDNAGTAAGRDGYVGASLRVEPDDAESAIVVVEIADDGPGVPAGYSDRIFDRLFRLDPSRHAGGSGLGLPIARGLARTVGGDVRHVGPATADGTGALFRLELPLVGDEASAPGSLQEDLNEG